MRIDEVFDTPTKLHRVDPKKIETLTGLRHLIATWLFSAEGIKYLVYVDTCSGNASKVTLGFAPMIADGDHHTKYKISHRPTGNVRAPLKVLGNVVQALRTYIDQEQPNRVHISGGFYQGQYDLYKTMSRCLQVPDGYRVQMDDRSHSIDIVAD